MTNAPEHNSRTLKTALRKAGLSNAIVQAAWPFWWSNEAELSPSAQTELRFALAKKLGLSAPALIGDRVDFVWKDEVRFKNVRLREQSQSTAIASYGVALGQILLSCSPAAQFSIRNISALDLRRIILSKRDFVDLHGLLSVCWSSGIPVISLNVFPLKIKGMQAIAAGSDQGHAILLGRDANYPALIAYDLAHELGHIALGHLANSRAIVDADGEDNDEDSEESDADGFALQLLTGQLVPDIKTTLADYNPRELARAVVAAGRLRRVEPGTLALCAAHKTQSWATAQASLRYIYTAPTSVSQIVNKVAVSQLDWEKLSEDNSAYLQSIIGVSLD